MEEDEKESLQNKDGSETNNQSSLADINLTKDSKNQQTIICQRCSSKILKPNNATYVEIEHFLPFMHRKSSRSEVHEGETLQEFWCVDDIYTFENVGFSNTVGSIKYLTCADCEIGPIGWHDLSTRKSYVSPQRVLNC
ncbi:guanine nucleotide exchange factor MSS4 [Centruroides vittatus]|uniref:guanine nucleotide exchange factor MSS4 n=1 Tax=Centruroides vittatus TaxID=120091 RepID=UPI00350F025D